MNDYPTPHGSHYMFIDGEQLRKTAEEVGRDWFGSPIDIDYRALQAGCEKVFYYDCLPARRPDSDDDEYQAKRDAKLAIFNQLRSLPGWHVSEGLARHRRKSRQEQKEVDILIAVDMLTHTHRKNMSRLTFVSGDQDFAPLIEAVVREGMYAELLYPEGHTSQDLMYFADVAKPMDIDFLNGISTFQFKGRHQLPMRSIQGSDTLPDGSLIGDGINGGEVFARIWRSTISGLYCIRTVCSYAGACLTVQGMELKLAERYFAHWVGRSWGIRCDSVEWVLRP